MISNKLEESDTPDKQLHTQHTLLYENKAGNGKKKKKSFYPDRQALPSEYLFWHIFTHVIAEITNWVNETIVKIIYCLY